MTETIYLWTKTGNQVIATPFISRSRQLMFSVEIVKDGEVIDHYTLMGMSALDFVTQREGWKKSKPRVKR